MSISAFHMLGKILNKKQNTPNMTKLETKSKKEFEPKSKRASGGI